MQKYRVNWVLLVSLIIGALVSSGGAYALWRFQLDRNAGTLKERAQVAKEEGDVREAVRNYSQYLALRPLDREARIDFATTFTSIVDLDDVTIDERLRLRSVLEDVVRNSPDQKDLQKRLVELYNSFGRPQDAIDHLGMMLERYPDDVELKSLRVQTLAQAKDYKTAIAYAFELVGYDKETGGFDVSKAQAPHEVSVYSNLAALLRSQNKDSELADHAMEQLIKENPDSSRAYLARALYRLGYDMEESGDADLQKAYEMDPEDPDILANVAVRLAAKEDLEKARSQLNLGIEKHPDDVRFYTMLSSVTLQEAAALKDAEARTAKYQEALEVLDQGMKSVKGSRQGNLMIAKAELQIRSQDFKGARETVQAMRDLRLPPVLTDYLDAVLMAHEGKWFAASQAMRKLRPQMNPAQLANLDFQLGLCYERLGRYELAREFYDSSVQADPTNEPARLGKQRVATLLGQSAIRPEDQSLEQLIRAERQKPAGQQNWDGIEKAMDELADTMEFSDVRRKLMKAELYIMRDDYAQARKFLTEANKIDPNDLDVRLAAVRLTAADSEHGPAAASRLLDKVSADFDDQPKIRILRAQLVLALNPEDRDQQLLGLLEGIDDWTDDQKLLLLTDLAAKFEAVGLRNDARGALMESSKLAPNDLPIRLRLFVIAHDQVDDAGMRDAQDRILEIVKDKQESTWLYTEGRRLLVLYRRGMVGAEVLPEIHDLLNQALEQRPDWHELYLLQADLALVERNDDEAIAAYERAVELGRANPAAIIQYTQLLTSRGQFAEAKRIAEMLPEPARLQFVGQLYAESLLNTRAVPEAIDVAKKVGEASPNDAARQFWYSQFLFRVLTTSKLSADETDELGDETEKGMRRSVELSPQSPESWSNLVRFYLFRDDRTQAEQALREAQLTIDTDRFDFWLAESYRMLGRWFDAEAQYLALCESNPTNADYARAIGVFYMSELYPQEDRKEKATPFINQILKAADDGELKPTDRNVLWAKRSAAEIMAEVGDYQSLLKAELLLRSNVTGNEMSTEDLLRMANILAPRPEPLSRRKVIRLLEEVKKRRPLNVAQSIVLAGQYFKLDEWSKCRSEMLATIRRYPNDPLVIQAYLTMLVERGTKADATRAIADRLNKLYELAPDEPMTVALAVRVLHKAERDREALQLIQRQFPANLAEIKEEDLPMVGLAAQLLVELEQLDAAENLYKFVASKQPAQAFTLAQFYGVHRGVEECFELLEKLYAPERAADIVAIAIPVLRAHRDEVNTLYDPVVEKWLDRALLEDPDSITFRMQQAEFLDIQQKYDGAVTIYQGLLERPDLKGRQRAIVLNNLSFLLALSGAEAEGADALKYVDEAANILGPTTDILDTRAVVLTSRKQYDEAIQDLELSVLDTPTSSKYFHKAVAHYLANDDEGALRAWEKAVELGLSRDDLNRLEFPRYEEMMEKMDQLKTRVSSASR